MSSLKAGSTEKLEQDTSYVVERHDLGEEFEEVVKAVGAPTEKVCSNYLRTL